MINTIVLIISFYLFLKIIGYISDWQQTKTNEEKKEIKESFQIIVTTILVIIAIIIVIIAMTL